MNDLDLFFPISQGMLPWQPILWKIGVFCVPISFVAVPFWNRLQYRNSDFKILNRMNFSTLYTILVTFGTYPNDCEDNNCTFLDETAKIGISDRISQQLLDRSSSAFQRKLANMQPAGDFKPSTGSRLPAVTFRQACGYLPSRRASSPIGQYQIILLGDKGTWVWTTCPRLLLDSAVAGARTRVHWVTTHQSDALATKLM